MSISIYVITAEGGNRQKQASVNGGLMRCSSTKWQRRSRVLRPPARCPQCGADLWQTSRLPALVVHLDAPQQRLSLWNKFTTFRSYNKINFVIFYRDGRRPPVIDCTSDERGWKRNCIFFLIVNRNKCKA